MLLTELWHQMCLLPLIQEEQHRELIRHSIGDLQITRRVHKLYNSPLAPVGGLYPSSASPLPEAWELEGPAQYLCCAFLDRDL